MAREAAGRRVNHMLVEVIVGAIGGATWAVSRDAWRRRCVTCRRRFAVFAFCRCRRHLVQA